MSRYAATTEVSSDRSRAEIERTLRRYGATSFGYGWEGAQALIMFEIANRRIRFILPLPDRQSPEFTETPTGKYRAVASQEAAYEQAVKQRWRALALVIKAKLEAIEANISTVESEFLAHIVLPDQSTVGEYLRPRLDEIYSTGKMLPMLPGLAALGDGR